jgi:ApbE superfamily uncharacterized protein (UPF0280 family)
MLEYKPRTYRSWTKSGDLVFFEIIEKETDLAIYASKDLEKQARASLLTCRQDLEGYISRDPAFYSSLEPVDLLSSVPQIAIDMAQAARRAGVGPMAAVAGAIAEFVGRDVGRFSDEIIVENGGDIFLRTAKNRTIGIYAGENSPFTEKLAIEVPPAEEGIGVCTSSGTVSHSLSFGKSDAVVVISRDVALADAVATAVGNVLKSPADITRGVDLARSIEGILGVLAIVKDKMGSWGEIRLAR